MRAYHINFEAFTIFHISNIFIFIVIVIFTFYFFEVLFVKDPTLRLPSNNLCSLITDLPHLLLIYSSLHFVIQTLRLFHYLICFLSLNKDSSSNSLEFSIPNSNSFWYDSTLQNPITNPLCS